MASPTATDLQTFMTAAGYTLTPEQAAQTSLFVADAVEWWENETGWSPFLAETQTQYYNPEDAHRDDDAGYYYITTRTGVLSVTSLVIAGVTQTASNDYWLDPKAANPARRIMLASYPSCERDAIVLTCSAGYASDWPQDAFLAVLKRAASQMTGMVLGTYGTGGSITQGPVSISAAKGTGEDASQPSRWQADALKTASRYRRWLPV